MFAIKKRVNLTEGNISTALLKLAVPIILTNFIQTAYGMIDMIWVGRLGSSSVAAVGTASFFINLALSLFALITIGTGIKISHAVGANNKKDINNYIKNGFVMTFLLSAIYTIVVITFRKQLIGFYELGPEVEKMAINFLTISAIGVVFMYFNVLLSTILNSFGESKIPFKANTIGIILNIVLDPILIFGVGSFKGLGVTGAAIATLLSRIIVVIIFIYMAKERFSSIDMKEKINLEKFMEVVKKGAPVAAQRVVFTLIAMSIGKIIADFGATAIAVQKVGVQIESISYMTIGGLQGAIAAFVGQNYGAGKLDRIKEGYKKSIIMTMIFGGTISMIFLVFPKAIFSIFMDEPQALEMGIGYMRILAISQVFMCMELLTVGAFNGIGRSYAPPIVSIIFTAARIPMAMVLSMDNLFGINGIWMSISVSSLIKGIILVTWFIVVIRYGKEFKEKVQDEKESNIKYSN